MELITIPGFVIPGLAAIALFVTSIMMIRAIVRSTKTRRAKRECVLAEIKKKDAARKKKEERQRAEELLPPEWLPAYELIRQTKYYATMAPVLTRWIAHETFDGQLIVPRLSVKALEFLCGIMHYKDSYHYASDCIDTFKCFAPLILKVA